MQRFALFHDFLVSLLKVSTTRTTVIGLAVVQFLALPGQARGEEQEVPQVERKVFYAADGPWGRLRCTHIHLEAPEKMVSRFAVPGPIPRWSFPEEKMPKLEALFRSAGMAEDFLGRVLNADRIVKEGGFVHLFPPIPDLEAMAPETRLIIYTQLANYPINQFHSDPILIVGETVQDWYASSKLRKELVQKIEQLSYVRSGTIAFSDPSVLIHYSKGEKEIQQIMKAMTRTRSLMVRLELDQSSNVAELVNYWTVGDGSRQKDIEPIINSIIATEGVETLSLAQLLPPLARKLIYTYPGIELAREGVFPDCHWTSLNFFSYEPRDYLLDSSLATSAVLENCVKVDPPYRYGDVMMFIDNGTGSAFHSCVYLADNIVYTKNGRNILSPWVVMKLENVQQLYMYKGDSRVQGYRRDLD